jgi:hypothetical protein
MLLSGGIAWAFSDEEIDGHLSSWPPLSWLRLLGSIDEHSLNWKVRCHSIIVVGERNHPLFPAFVAVTL